AIFRIREHRRRAWSRACGIRRDLYASYGSGCRGGTKGCQIDCRSCTYGIRERRRYRTVDIQRDRSARKSRCALVEELHCARERRCAEWSFIQKLRCLRVAVENQAVLSEIVSALVGEVECDGDG